MISSTLYPPQSGGGSGSPGPAGKSAYQLAQQQGFVGTLDEWIASLNGHPGEPGEDGVDGRSVDLQKSATAIQWRRDGGAFADLVTLEEIRGPGALEGPGHIDVGNVRMAWGSADSAGIPSETFLFPVEFSQPPSVVINRLTPGIALAASATDKNGFTVERAEAYMNPAPFTWTALGLKSGQTAPPQGFNIDALPVWSAAVRAQRAGKRNSRVLCLGDSTTAGNGANAAGMATNDIAAAYPKLLSDLFTARGSRGNWQSLLGTHNATSLNAFDNRISHGASWAATATARTVGGPTFYTKGTQTVFNFAPTQPWDTAEFYYTKTDPANGTGLIASVNSVDYATFLAYNPPGYPVVSDPVLVKASAVGLHTLNTRGVNTVDSFLLGIVTYRSDQTQTLVLNGGWSGAKASDWLTDRVNSYGPMQCVALYNPDLVIINLGINEAATSVPTATYKSQMQTIISIAKATGADVVLVIPNDCNSTQVGIRLTEISIAIAELATANGLLCIDLRTTLGTYAQATASGYMRDNLHPNAAGYAKIAETIAQVVMPVSGSGA